MKRDAKLPLHARHGIAGNTPAPSRGKALPPACSLTQNGVFQPQAAPRH